MSAFDEIVVAHQLLLTGDGLIVAEQVDRVHIAIHQVPSIVIKHLRDAVADEPGRRDPHPRLFPLASQGNRIITAGVISVNIKDLDGIQELVVVAVEVEAILNFLPPQRHGLLAVGHPRLDGPGHDLAKRSEVVMAVR